MPEWPPHEPDEETGYDADDPKHPDYADHLFEIADAQRKRQKEDGYVPAAEPKRWMSEDRMVRVLIRDDGTAEFSTRHSPTAPWARPILLFSDRTVVPPRLSEAEVQRRRDELDKSDIARRPSKGR